jgi:hypothetical protein
MRKHQASARVAPRRIQFRTRRRGVLAICKFEHVWWHVLHAAMPFPKCLDGLTRDQAETPEVKSQFSEWLAESTLEDRDAVLELAGAWEIRPADTPIRAEPDTRDDLEDMVDAILDMGTSQDVRDRLYISCTTLGTESGERLAVSLGIAGLSDSAHVTVIEQFAAGMNSLMVASGAVHSLEGRLPIGTARVYIKKVHDREPGSPDKMYRELSELYDLGILDDILTGPTKDRTVAANAALMLFCDKMAESARQPGPLRFWAMPHLLSHVADISTCLVAVERVGAAVAERSMREAERQHSSRSSARYGAQEGSVQRTHGQLVRKSPLAREESAQRTRGQLVHENPSAQEESVQRIYDQLVRKRIPPRYKNQCSAYMISWCARESLRSQGHPPIHDHQVRGVHVGARALRLNAARVVFAGRR